MGISIGIFLTMMIDLISRRDNDIKLFLLRTIWNFIFLIPVFGLLSISYPFSIPGERYNDYMMNMINRYPVLYAAWHIGTPLGLIISHAIITAL